MSEVQAWPAFIDGYNRERSIQIDNQRTVNMYVIQDNESPEKQAFAMMPGLLYDYSLGGTGDATRSLGKFAFRGSVYSVVSDQFFYEQSFLNFILTSSGIIHWSSLENQVIFADGSTVYVYDTSNNSFTIVNETFITNPGKITSFNQMIIVPIKGSNVWYASALNQGQTYDANRFNVFQLKPDTLMGAATINNRLLLFGQIHTECYIPQVTASIPVVRDNNVVIDFGTWSDGSIVTTTEEQGVKFVTWLARDELGGAFFMLTEGVQGVKISTPAIDILLQNFTNLEDCYGFSYRIDGHLFIEWSFTTDDVTLVYDATTKKWIEREMLNGHSFIINSHAYANGVHWMGSRVDGSVYKMSSSYLTYYSAGSTTENIHRQRISPIWRDPSQVKFTHSYAELKMEMGTAPANISPVVYMQTSRNNDAFDNARQGLPGAQGQGGYKVYWNGMGAFYSIIYKFDMYQPYRTYIMGFSLIGRKGRR